MIVSFLSPGVSEGEDRKLSILSLTRLMTNERMFECKEGQKNISLSLSLALWLEKTTE